MVDFVVNTGQTRVDLDKLTQQVSKLGKALDQIEAKAEKGQEGMSTAMLIAKDNARIASEQFTALSKNVGSLNTLLRQTDILSRYNKAILEVAAGVEKSTLNAIKLESATQLTVEGYRTAELAAKERLKTAEASNTAEVRSEEAFRRSAIALDQLATITGRLAAIEAQRVAGAKAVVVEEQKQADTVALLAEKTALLNTEKGKQAATDKVAYDSAVRMATAEAKQAASIAETAQAINLLKGPEGQRLAALKAQEAAVKAVATEDIRRAANIEKLRSEVLYLASAEGKETLALEKQIAVMRGRVASSLGSQLTSGLRAGLMGLKTSIGMYTSSTILAASAVFGLSRAFRTGIEAGAEFTASMARAQAIMGATPGEASALQARVEALGASTQFSATQVAQATVELAKVGMSATQAMTALKPVLDLATLGDTDIASAAKLATDVMFVFGKQVRDLGDINDVMATAVSRSSTNLDELVKGLTYAGPAAHAAGISMRDTVAAMEALANAGIRGSRAGTALRMMIDRLADPTAKGAAALQKMGVSLLDLQGKAKSLTSVLQEFQEAQRHMGGPEFLAGLGDIFGVRQASAVANLVNNTDSMVKFRKELELTDGASDKMVQSLRDVAKFDWENLTSAFQALQISVFQDNEYQIRGFIESLRHFFDFLNERIGDGGVTRLESYITRLTHLGEAVAAAFAVKYLIQFSSAMQASVNKLAAKELAYGLVAQGAIGAKVATDSYTASVIKETIAVDASAVGMKAAAGRMAMSSAGMAGIAAGASTLGRVLSVGGAVLGWVGIIASVGFALWQGYKAITDSGAKTSEELKKRTDEAKEAYKTLKEASDEMEKSQEKVDFGRSVDFQRDAVSKLQESIKATEKHRDAMLKDAKTEAERVAITKSYGLILDEQNTKLKEAAKQLADYFSVGADMQAGAGSPETRKTTVLVIRMEDLRRKILDVQTAADGTKKSLDEMSPDDRGKLKGYTDALNQLGIEFAKAAEAERTFKSGQLTPDQALGTAAKLVQEAGTKAFNEHADAALKSSNALDDAAKAATKTQSAYEAARQAVEDAKSGAGDLKEATDKLATATWNNVAAQKEYKGLLGDLARSSHDLAHDYDLGMMPAAQRKAEYLKEFKKSNDTVNALLATSKAAGIEDPALNPTLAFDYNQALMKRTEAARGAGLFNQAAPSASSQKSVDTFLSNLREQLNPIAEAAREANEQLEKLKSYKGDDKGLLQGQVAFNQLKSSLEFSTDPLQKQVDDIEAWRQTQVKLASAITDTTKRQQILTQINREADQLENQRITTLLQGKQAIEDYADALNDQETALQQQMDDRVAAIGVGSQEGQQMQAMAKLQRDYNTERVRLQKESTRAIEAAQLAKDPEEVKRLKDKYAQEEQDLKESYARRAYITQQGYEDLLKAQGSVTLGIKGGLSQVIEDGTNMAGKMQQAVVGGFNDMADAVANFATTGKFSLKQFATDFVQMLVKMEAEALLAKAALAILGLFARGGNYAVDTGGAGASGTGINWGAMFGSSGGTYSGVAGAHGLAFNNGTVTAMAKGGLITKPTLFPMANGGVALGGEAGTEAIMPLKRTAGGDLGVNVMGGGGGGDVFNINTVVNVDSSGASSSKTSSNDDSKAGRQLAKMIEAQTNALIVRATQPGGILWKQRNGVTA